MEFFPLSFSIFDLKVTTMIEIVASAHLCLRTLDTKNLFRIQSDE